MSRMLDLADAARSSGLQVVEVSGWKTRGKTPMNGPGGIDCHHTATAAKAVGDIPTLRMLISGRSDLAGPLCHLGLSRTGVVYVVASGRANHAGATDLLKSSNSWAIGIEAEHPGVGAWPSVQYQAYVRLCAALSRWYGIPNGLVRGHKEIAVPRGRKSDPNFDMGAFRSAVLAVSIGALTSAGATELQMRLALLGFMPNVAASIDGDVGPVTRAATLAFQSAAGLTATGVADGATVKALTERDLKLGTGKLIVIGRSLAPGERLRPGEMLRSSDGSVTLNFQWDGNVVLYRDGKAVWQTRTRGTQLANQMDGNLVLYLEAGGRSLAVWASSTVGRGGNLVCQDDGNLVLYSGTKATWQTGTYRKA